MIRQAQRSWHSQTACQSLMAHPLSSSDLSLRQSRKRRTVSSHASETCCLSAHAWMIAPTCTHTSNVRGRSPWKRGHVFSYPSGMAPSSVLGHNFLYAAARRFCGSRRTINDVHPSCAPTVKSPTHGALPSVHASSHVSHTSLGSARTASAALPPSCQSSATAHVMCRG
jgi:hypothetical protein